MHGLSWSAYDKTALWAVLHKCTQELVDPLHPLPSSHGIDETLALTCTRLHHLLLQQALVELQDIDIKVPVLLVDIHPAADHTVRGHIAGAMLIKCNVLQWRFDLQLLDRGLDIATQYDLRVIE
jgi:hypothetical protein